MRPNSVNAPINDEFGSLAGSKEGRAIARLTPFLGRQLPPSVGALTIGAEDAEAQAAERRDTPRQNCGCSL